MLVLPIIYNKVEPVKEQVRGFFLAASGGLFTCTVLVILWVYSVLKIVPQVDGCSGKYTGVVNSSETTTSHLITIHQDDCYSLERSRQLGEISTVPLTAIIVEEFPEYRWVGKTMQAFILISITVAFLAYGLGMIHLHSIQEMFVEGSSDTGRSPSKCQKLVSYKIFRTSVFLLAFLLICAVALSRPQGFVILMEFVITILLNILTGFFLVIMIHQSKTEKYRDLAVTWKFPEKLYYIKYLIALYFGFGIAFALYKYAF
ncbi:uncharacterized protein LOC117118308 isoform X3 [Anneissia japonica]|uniref:uncharacterized protein LOC117118308 isoform X3 n=1 Tax=Anneissia japonica TaxID=1529436 RepID=UPI00142587EA|nr:uncharacterized protein LOC117118308 isoform X3 [Anneissia japonica]